MTILVTGTYKITADVTTITGLTITSTSSEAKLTVNTGSGFVDVAGTKTIIANGTVDGSGNTGTLHKVLACNAGDILRVMAQRSSGPGTVTTVANGCRIIIESL